jgi:hypothetical protein
MAFTIKDSVTWPLEMLTQNNTVFQMSWTCESFYKGNILAINTECYKETSDTLQLMMSLNDANINVFFTLQTATDGHMLHRAIDHKLTTTLAIVLEYKMLCLQNTKIDVQKVSQ